MKAIPPIFVLFAFALCVWLVGRTPEGRIRHFINRLCVVGAFVCVGMWFGCFAIEASGYLLPIEDWCGTFLGWLLIFWLFYSRTRPRASSAIPEP